MGLLPCSWSGRNKRHGSSRSGGRFGSAVGGRAHSGMENVDRAERDKPAVCGCRRQGLGTCCRCAILLISHLAHIPALSLLSSPHSAPAICGDQLACPCGCRKDGPWAVSGAVFWGWARTGFLGRVPGLWIRYLSGEGGGRTRDSQPMTHAQLQSSHCVYGTPARIYAPAPQADYLRVSDIPPESRDRVSG